MLVWYLCHCQHLQELVTGIPKNDQILLEHVQYCVHVGEARVKSKHASIFIAARDLAVFDGVVRASEDALTAASQ